MDVKPIQGRATSRPIDRTTSLAKFSVRTQRLAFIIHTSLGKKQIEEIILYNTWTWGGFYNVLVPCSPSGISEDYLRLLIDYDPDRLIFCGRVPATVRNDLIDHIQPFNAIDQKSILPTKKDPRSFVNNISTPQVLVREVNNLKGEFSSRVKFPTVPKSNPFRPYAVTHVGFLDDRLQDFYEDRLKAERIDYSGVSSLGDYLSRMDTCLANLYPMRLTQRHLNPTFRMGFSGDAIIAFGEPYEVEGLCLFWNWRMDASGGFVYPPHEAFAFLPPESVKTKNGLNELAAWIRAKHQHGHITLLAPPALKPFLRGLRKRLQPLLGTQFKQIDIVSTASFIPITKCPESEVTKEIGWSGNEAMFETPTPEFDLDWLKEEAWVVDCDFSDFRTDRQSYYPPRRPGQMQLLLETSYPKFTPVSIRGGPWRLSRQGVACLATLKNRLISVRLPSAEAILETVLLEAGFQFRLSDKCGYVRSTTDILSDAGQLKKLRRKGFRDLLYEMSKVKPLTQGQIKSVVKPGRETAELEDFLLSMLAATGFFRGATYRCPSCGVSSWHSVAMLNELLTCPGCARTLQPPLEFFHSFKMSTLLETTVEQGGIPVILTEGVLKNLARKTLYTVPGVIATDSTGVEADIDILASCDGRVVCAECKTLDRSPKSSSIATIVRQLEKDYGVASQLEADVFAVSILSNNIPEKIKTFVRRKNRQARGPFAIIIRLEDLERGFLLRTCVDRSTHNGIGGQPIDIGTMLSLGRANGFQI